MENKTREKGKRSVVPVGMSPAAIYSKRKTEGEAAGKNWRGEVKRVNSLPLPGQVATLSGLKGTARQRLDKKKKANGTNLTGSLVEASWVP
jgi:hypothetical protein